LDGCRSLLWDCEPSSSSGSISAPTSTILANQVKNLDWVGREASLKGRVTPNELMDVRAKTFDLIGKGRSIGNHPYSAK